MFELKKTKSNLYYIYTVYDTMAKRYRGTFYHTTDEEFVRQSLPSILMDFPLRDIKIYRIGMFDDVQGIIRPCMKREVNTSCYTFPHSRLSSKGDDLPTEELDVEMKKLKAETIDKLKSNISENIEKSTEA